MQTHITLEEMAAAARHLAKTEAGRAAMQRLLLLEKDTLELDLLERRAFLALLGGAWAGQAGTMRKLIEESLARHSAEGRGR